mgnify:CR=1 FL=1
MLKSKAVIGDRLNENLEREYIDFASDSSDKVKSFDETMEDLEFLKKAAFYWFKQARYLRRHIDGQP